MFKNVTPRQIAFWVAVMQTLLLLALYYFLHQYHQLNVNGFLMFNILIMYALCSYFMVFGFIDTYIFRKVKLIYKTIHKYKSNPDYQRRGDISEAIFEDVEMEVMHWVVESERQINDLKTMEEYRRNFVGNVSHELRTPIFNIQGYLETLIEDAGQNPALNEKYLLRAAKNTERLRFIVDDLLAIDKLESGQFRLDIQAFDIIEVIKEINGDFLRKATEQDITLSLKSGTMSRCYVKADLESVQKILINLIANTLKYGRKQGNTRIGVYDMAQRILIEVTDDGIGIDEIHLPYLFDRFYRVDKARTHQEGSSGLGLAIVKHLVEAHQQTINVRSTVGIGTTFAFTLEKA